MSRKSLTLGSALIIGLVGLTGGDTLAKGKKPKRKLECSIKTYLPGVVGPRTVLRSKGGFYDNAATAVARNGDFVYQASSNPLNTGAMILNKKTGRTAQTAIQGRLRGTLSLIMDVKGDGILSDARVETVELACSVKPVDPYSNEFGE